MRKHLSIFTASAFMLGYGATYAIAQQGADSRMMHRLTQERMQQNPDYESMTKEPSMMGRKMLGQGNRMGMARREMGRGIPGPIGINIIFILMDSNGDGAISLQEL